MAVHGYSVTCGMLAKDVFFCRYNTVDMCVAVATEAGLITPIVFGADRKVGIFCFIREAFMSYLKLTLLICVQLMSLPLPMLHPILMQGSYGCWIVVKF